MTTPTPEIARLDVPLPQLVAELRKPYRPSPQELARQAAAAEHLAQVAAKAGLTPEDVLKAGAEAERRHVVLDLDADSACPFEGASRYPYLRTGGQS
ncbi:hypothetical protein ACLF6K_37155 [Streptomyces xanthophaeus]|uniref:hypothetical protein n=1 Tax=Streptomyces xanthophaeus TaxID=67385 RepID=UPI003990319D